MQTLTPHTVTHRLTDFLLAEFAIAVEINAVEMFRYFRIEVIYFFAIQKAIAITIGMLKALSSALTQHLPAHLDFVPIRLFP